MYAVISAGGKQERVEVGQRIEVELLAAATGDEVNFAPVLFVDDATIVSTPKELADVVVSGRIVGESKGPKINGFTYKAKARGRRRYGHRQHYQVVEITTVEIKKVAAKAKA
jgi:large subunit ribosomal protein L21